MEQVLGIYAQMASERLHRHQLESKVFTAWTMASYFNDRQTHQPDATMAPAGCSADPLVLTTATKQLLPKIRPGILYARAGIVITELHPVGTQPIFKQFSSPCGAKTSGTVLGYIHREHGPSALGLGSAGLREGPA